MLSEEKIKRINELAKKKNQQQLQSNQRKN